LGEFLLNKDQIKIFHSGSQDYEVFDLLTDKKRIPNVVDTQLAAQFLNTENCMGLGHLISNVLNIEIGKTETVSDWTKRPLTEKQLQYACEDVLYLHKVYQTLEYRLKKAGKYEYFLEECQLQSIIKSSTDNIVDKHLKPSDSLRFKAIFKDLVEWREDMARKKNLPRTWILKDPQLKKIAKSYQPQIWLNTEFLSEKQIQSYGDVFKSIHDKHENLSPKPLYSSHREKLNFEKLFGLVKSRITRCATRAEIPVELICNQRTLKQKVYLMIEKNCYQPFQNWRGDLLNESLSQVYENFVTTTSK
jgi:ribonuclease D